MAKEPKTAGLLTGPVWLLVRPVDRGGHPRALGPIYSLDKLRGVAAGIAWVEPGAKIEGHARKVPEGYKQVPVGGDDRFEELEELTFEQQLINVLWYDYKENRWDDEKEWNSDRWQDVGLLLEMFGIQFPGEDAPIPADAGVEDP